MSRLPDLRRDQLTADGQAVWDGIVGTRGSRLVTANGALAGPFNAFVHAAARIWLVGNTNFKGVWDTLVNAPSGHIKDDILQFNQSFDSIASL
jgi:hypothetical protein